MSRNSKQGLNQCQNHCFSLKPIMSKRHFNKKIHASFCKFLKKNKKLSQSEITDSGCSLFPIFNKDQNYATPGFILPNQKKYFIENRKTYLKDHKRKVREYQEITNDLYVPQPRSSHGHCNVCCQPYQDYFQHINSQKHHQQIKQSRFNRYILQLQKKLSLSNSSSFSYKRSYQQRNIEINNIDEQNQNNQNQKLSNQLQRNSINSSSRKKIKLDSPQQNNFSSHMKTNEPFNNLIYTQYSASSSEQKQQKENHQLSTWNYISSFAQNHQNFNQVSNNIFFNPYLCCAELNYFVQYQIPLLQNYTNSTYFNNQIFRQGINEPFEQYMSTSIYPFQQDFYSLNRTINQTNLFSNIDFYNLEAYKRCLNYCNQLTIYQQRQPNFINYQQYQFVYPLMTVW